MRHELVELEGWYAARCDGVWEHDHGVRIDTIDNPGWSLVVDLDSEEAMRLGHCEAKFNRAPDNWIACAVSGSRFEGYGGPSNLRDIIGVFLDWVQAGER